MTPYYEHAGITIYHGDCREILPGLPKVDAVITDPPYGIAWNTDYSAIKNSSRTVIRPSLSAGGHRKSYPAIKGDDGPFDPSPWLSFRTVVMWGANNFSDKLPRGGWLIWDKRDLSGGCFMSEAEGAWTNQVNSVRIFSHCWQGFSRASENSEHYHPTQKPVALMAWCIQKSKAEGTILDPFMGSGTTLVAAKNLGRKAIGIEIEEKYCEISAKRLSQEVFDFTGASV